MDNRGAAEVAVDPVALGLAVALLSITNWGRLATVGSSRLARLRADVLPVSKAKLTSPEPRTTDVTSKDNVLLAANDRGDAMAVAPVGGRLL